MKNNVAFTFISFAVLKRDDCLSVQVKLKKKDLDFVLFDFGMNFDL